MSKARATRLSEVIEEAAAEGGKRRSYFSFGDNGLTATVGASGSLLRITQHFPGERTGFCVDHPDSPEPYFVQKRLRKLLSCSKRPFCKRVIGPHIDALCQSYHLSTEDTSMINDRWPTFHRKLKNGDSLKLQYMASNGTIFQIFETSGQQGHNLPPLAITPDLLIRNLDYSDHHNEFNEAVVDDEKVYSYEIQENCLIRVHEDVDRKAILYIQALDEQRSLEFSQLDGKESVTAYVAASSSGDSEEYYTRRSSTERHSVQSDATKDLSEESSFYCPSHQRFSAGQSVSEQSFSDSSSNRSATTSHYSASRSRVASWLSSQSFIESLGERKCFDENFFHGEPAKHEHTDDDAIIKWSSGIEPFSEEPFSEEPFNEDFVNEEFVNEEFVNEEFVNEEFVNEGLLNEGSTACRHGASGASGSSYQLRWKTTKPSLHDWPEHGVNTIILAYTINYVSKDEAPIPPSISWDTTYETICQFLTPHRPLRLSSNHIIDFFLRRNLEHILSVCSIPVPLTRDERYPAVALTCGDVDSHRVATAASHYAFQMLLQGLKWIDSQHLNPPHEGWVCECHEELPKSCVCLMRRRILRVCRGHMKWLFARAHRSGRPFCPNYWVDGSEIKRWKLIEDLPKRCLVDTPFQLIKAGDFYKQSSERILFKSTIKKVVREWIDDLDKLDKRRAYAFPKSDKETPRNFYLTDHVLIWQAIKSAEHLGVELRTERDYSSKYLQRIIVGRFTTENPLSKKQMVSVRRSATYTRFLLRSKDSPLFRAMDEGLFDNPGIERNRGRAVDVWCNKNEAWKNTIDCQTHHDDNDDKIWDDPKRFALAMIIVKHLKMNINQRSRPEMLEQAMSVLFSASSANGLFPGRLNKHHQPILYESELARDQYWANTFEIPHIVWTYCSELDEDPPGSQELEADTRYETNMAKGDIAESQSHLISRIHMLLQEASSSDVASRALEHSTRYSMKPLFPFNNMVDERNVVELEDEWLYDLPAFFVPSTETKTGERFPSSPEDRTPQSDTDSRKVHRIQGYKIDYLKLKSPRKTKSHNNTRSEILETQEKITEIMARGRAPEDSKKRLWVLSSLHPSGNEVCLKTVSRQERKQSPKVEIFFDRHLAFDKLFWENTSLVKNTWTTNLHLSFPTLNSDKQEQKQASGIQQEVDITFPPLVRGDQPTCLMKSVMSFSFEGDMFDRYWTGICLIAGFAEMPDFLSVIAPSSDDERGSYDEEDDGEDQTENDQAGDTADVSGSLESDESDKGGNLSSDDGSLPEDDVVISFSDSKIFQQRRFIELMFYFDALDYLRANAQKVLDTTTELLEKGKADLRKSFEATQGEILSQEESEIEKLDHKGFLITHQRFQEFQASLQRVEGHFADNLRTIDLWLNREKAREAERPRWSLNDESRYQPTIIKVSAACNQRLQLFKACHNGISNLIKSTSEDLEVMRNYLDIMQSDLDLRRSEDIKRFTYVTVVFLPLGFATGIFSTSGSPARITLVRMILTAIATLTTTVIALVIYKFADSSRSRDEFIKRSAAFKSRMLKRITWILRTLLDMLVTDFKSLFLNHTSNRSDEFPPGEEDRHKEEQERGTSERPIDKATNRPAAFKARLLGRIIWILRTLLDMLVDFRDLFFNQTNNRSNEIPLGEEDGDQEEQERGTSERNEDEGSQLQRRQSEGERSNQNPEGQRAGTANRQEHDLAGRQTGGPAANYNMRAADEWRLGAILRDFRTRSTGDVEERFREDVERRASSGADAVGYFEGDNWRSSRGNSAPLRIKRLG